MITNSTVTRIQGHFLDQICSLTEAESGEQCRIDVRQRNVSLKSDTTDEMKSAQKIDNHGKERDDMADPEASAN